MQDGVISMEETLKGVESSYGIIRGARPGARTLNRRRLVVGTTS